MVRFAEDKPQGFGRNRRRNLFGESFWGIHTTFKGARALQGRVTFKGNESTAMPLCRTQRFPFLVGAFPAGFNYRKYEFLVYLPGSHILYKTTQQMPAAWKAL